ncbi:MAG: C10 family peptidase [Chitinophagaceae bacterium]|nr:C10 family peptidase [Chitinophagaceae bacterium]
MDQFSPYNQYCPNGTFSGGHMPPGCVPVAMAQVMRFWSFPTSYNYGIMPKSLFVDPYYLNISGYNETARLISDIGSHDITKWTQIPGQFVTYSDKGTSTNDYYCPSVFGDFGYTSASRTETVSDQILWGAKNGLSYAGLLSNELSTNLRPCIMGGYPGQNTAGGLVYYPYLILGTNGFAMGYPKRLSTLGLF